MLAAFGVYERDTPAMKYGPLSVGVIVALLTVTS
jgi:hypothetical protein